MPAQIIITEPARNVVEATTATNVVEVTEVVNTISISTTIRSIGNAALSADIGITNTIGDALAGGIYTAGTSLESIVRDLVAPFLEPQFLSVSWSAVGYQESDGEDLRVECGYSVTVNSLNVAWQNKDNLQDNTALYVIDTSSVPPITWASPIISNYDALATPYEIPTNYTLGSTLTPLDRTITLKAFYLSNNGAGPSVELEKSVKIKHRHRFVVLAFGSDSIVGPPSTFFVAADEVYSSLELDPGENLVSVNCTADTANTNNYTFFMVPVPYTIREVAAQVSSLGVADYTDSLFQFPTTYSRGVGNTNVTYNVYRTLQPGAFDSDVTLKLTITD